jgi:hypothetical protein
LRFLRDLIENTDTVHTATDFTRYTYRLRHWDNHIVHLLQYDDLDSVPKLQVETLRGEVRIVLNLTSGQLELLIMNMLGNQTAPPLPQGALLGPGEGDHSLQVLVPAPLMVLQLILLMVFSLSLNLNVMRSRTGIFTLTIFFGILVVNE